MSLNTSSHSREITVLTLPKEMVYRIPLYGERVGKLRTTVHEASWLTLIFEKPEGDSTPQLQYGQAEHTAYPSNETQSNADDQSQGSCRKRRCVPPSFLLGNHEALRAHLESCELQSAEERLK
jgi:hypothetical protein